MDNLLYPALFNETFHADSALTMLQWPSAISTWGSKVCCNSPGVDQQPHRSSGRRTDKQKWGQETDQSQAGEYFRRQEPPI